MFSLCVPGSSTRRATQRRNVSSTRPLSTATPSSPSSPSSEPWDASRSTLLMHPERWVSEYQAGICAALLISQVVFLCKYIARCNKGNSYLVICHPSPLGTSLLTPSSAAGHTELLGFSITFITLHLSRGFLTWELAGGSLVDAVTSLRADFYSLKSLFVKRRVAFQQQDLHE